MIYLSSSSPCCPLFTPLIHAFDLGNETLRPNETCPRPNENMIASSAWNHDWIQPKNGPASVLYEGENRFFKEKTTINELAWHDLMKWCKNFSMGALNENAKRKFWSLMEVCRYWH